MSAIDSQLTLAKKVEEFTQDSAFVGKKLICCPPNDALSALMDKLLPLSREMAKICKDAVG